MKHRASEDVFYRTEKNHGCMNIRDGERAACYSGRSWSERIFVASIVFGYILSGVWMSYRKLLDYFICGKDVSSY